MSGMNIDHRAASWVIHQNSGQLKHTCSAKEADEAIRLGFRVENQYATPDAMAVARFVREACRASIENPMNLSNPDAVRRCVDNIDLAQVIGVAMQAMPFKRTRMGGEGGHDAIADYLLRASLTPSLMADTMDHAQLAALGRHKQGEQA